jgi:glutamate N-acetyltransferase/amino-acid N-acetyltransferase
MAGPIPVSKLARPLPDLPPVAGVRFAAAAAGIRYRDRTDLMLAEFAPGTTVAGVFTRNRCPGAPVWWCRRALAGGAARGLLVNAGNANVFTGAAGDAAVRRSAEAAAARLGCPPDEVFVASTGVIGEPLPVERIEAAMDAVHEGLSADGWPAAARAIMTTDTFPKAVTRTARIGGTEVRISGIAKGSGMIAPDLATMLAFVVTDAAIPAARLQALLKAGVERSFNCITVDSDTSAIAGEDANWGRIVMAVGKAGETADRDRLSVAVGGVWMARGGAVVEGYDEAPVVAHMRGDQVRIEVDLGLGRGRARVWTCDLTHGYIDINGSYRS